MRLAIGDRESAVDDRCNGEARAGAARPGSKSNYTCMDLCMYLEAGWKVCVQDPALAGINKTGL